ncbi:MAG TPA: hypothetical protein VEA80_15075 [Vitreimonas sp.]|uniref:hypothetical protein n=1 Tax=Vitreimonas sp. TaxID=3069702 RepID=UPI002D279095|nr:hypothetical protein [Vitreimonas sp.]HYD88795.1 hypothetical protein [Vitreimonas sp.]
MIRAIGIVVALLATGFYLAPKVRLHPLSMGVTNNNWQSHITYRSADGRHVVICDFFGHDSTPYWEGQNNWEDQNVCLDLPVYLHQGLPPLLVQVEIGGQEVELRSPLLWGRLI